MLSTTARILAALVAVFTLAGPTLARADLIFVTLQSSVVSFDLSSGNSATIAASKTTVASGLTEAMGLVFDNAGYLYVANYTPGTVSKIDISTGVVSAFASGFVTPRGITYNPAANNFYVANSGSPGSISEVTSAGAVSSYVAFGSNTSPYGLALDATGALYSGNNASQTLSKIEGGVPSTFASFLPLTGTRGVAVSSAGDIYTAVANGVQKTTSGGSTSTFIASGMGFPNGMAFDSGGNLLVASYTDSLIYAYDSSGTQLYSFSTGVLSSDRPRFVAFDVDGSGFNQSAAPAPAVPEPGTWAAAALLAGGAAFARWRRRKNS